jgi:hypothetical protein
MATHYLNTDLDIAAAFDITPLVSLLQAQGFSVIHCEPLESGEWHATLEVFTSQEPPENYRPEVTILQMVPILEALTGEAKEMWNMSTERCLDMGFNCCAEPWQYRQDLSSETLARIAALGITLRITLYPVN